MGAALTLGDKAAGAVKGGFHGVAGGAGWAMGIAPALLIYWVVFRGGRLNLGTTETACSIIAASFGGFLSGITLSFLLGFVFQNQSLYNAGWLLSQNPPDLTTKLADMLIHTRHGWITPVFGIAVGAGIAWSLRSMFADPRTEIFVAQHEGAIRSLAQVSRSVRRIGNRVFRKSWRTFLAVAAGALLVFLILEPGPGICDPAASTFRAGESQRGQCFADSSLTLMPLPARVAGMLFIIWIGGVFLQIGLLFGILSARVGVKLERDTGFLKAVHPVVPVLSSAAADRIEIS
jgi:hypothetical protein